MSINSNSLNSLPDDAALVMLSKLGVHELATCCQLSHHWHILANNPELWKTLAQKIFNENLPQVTDIKLFLIKNPTSHQELIKRIKKFLNTLSLNQKCRFRCAFKSSLFEQKTEYFLIHIESSILYPAEMKKEKTGSNEGFDVEEEYQALYELSDPLDFSEFHSQAVDISSAHNQINIVDSDSVTDQLKENYYLKNRCFKQYCYQPSVSFAADFTSAKNQEPEIQWDITGAIGCELISDNQELMPALDHTLIPPIYDLVKEKIYSWAK